MPLPTPYAAQKLEAGRGGCPLPFSRSVSTKIDSKMQHFCRLKFAWQLNPYCNEEKKFFFKIILWIYHSNEVSHEDSFDMTYNRAVK